MFIDDFKTPFQEIKHEKFQKRRHVEPKNIYHWIDDDVVTRCYQCGIEFGIFKRKHHCRNCGRIFCYDCSDKKKKLSKKKTNKLFSFLTGEKERVCIKCFNKITEQEEIEDLINIFKLNHYLDIKDYSLMSCICEGWSKLALRYFSKFREIQYKLIDDIYDEEETLMLKSNSKYFEGHNIWKIHLVKSIKWDEINNFEKIIKIILSKNKKCNCWNLMCSRSCCENISTEDVLLCLEHKNKINEKIINVLLNSLGKISMLEFSCFISIFLQHCSKYDINDLAQKPIIKFLIKQSQYTNNFIYLLFWEINYFKYGQHKKLYSKIEEILFENIKPNIQHKINIQKNLADFLTNSFKKKYSKHQFVKINEYLKKNIYKNNIPILTNPTLNWNKLCLRKIKMKLSNSKPLIIPCVVENKTRKIKYEMLYKKEDLRKEKIIMSTIILMDKIFKKEEKIDLNIIKYHIRPINHEEGFIEIIPNSITLHELKQQGFSIQNYIIENNSERSMEEIRMRFVNSCAAYCVITYLLGIGDRHLENIMLTKSGLLFHIDYGFILGNEPKFMAPEIRITPEMVDAMGGFDSKYYKKFQGLCSQFYNCLRRHVNLFMIVLSMLHKITPKIENGKFTKKIIKEQIVKRFLPNENYEEAKLKFKTRVENSHKSSYNSFFIDFFHKSNSDMKIFKNIGENSKNDEMDISGSSLFDIFWRK